MSDAQTWSVIGLLAATFLGLFTEMRSQFRVIRGDLTDIKVLLARVDQKLSDHIEHHPGGVA